MFRTIFAGAALCAIAVPAMAQTSTIGTGGAAVSYVTVNSGVAYGQTFQSPGGLLTDFTINPRSISNPGGTFTFEINNLSGNTVGATLYSVTFTPTQNFTPVTFSGINIATTSGANYVALVTPFGGNAGTTQLQLVTNAGTDYAGGSQFTVPGGNPVGQTGTANNGFDVQFSATFATPEPASWAMMIGGFGVIGGAMRRRRKVAALA